MEVGNTLPETASLPLKFFFIPKGKANVFQPSIFRGKLACWLRFRETNWIFASFFLMHSFLVSPSNIFHPIHLDGSTYSVQGVKVKELKPPKAVAKLRFGGGGAWCWSPTHPKKTGVRQTWKYLCIYIYIWVFPKIGVGPQNGWFIMENPIFGNTHIYIYHKHGTVYGILTYRLVNLYGKGKVNRPYIESLGV